MIDREHMERHSTDVERLTQIAYVNGVIVTPEQAYSAWSEASDNSAASWLMLDENDSWVWSRMSSYLGKVPLTTEGLMTEFAQDIERIVDVARRNGTDLTQSQAYSAWRRASAKSWNANWLELPSYDHELWSEIRSEVEKVLEEA